MRRIQPDGSVEIPQPHPRIMEIRDHFIQTGCVEIGQIILEFSECIAGAVKMAAVFNGLIGSGSFDKRIASPVLTGIGAVKGPAVGCWNKDQRFTFRDSAAFPDLFLYMGRDLLNVVHQHFRVMKDAGVDPLQDVPVKGMVPVFKKDRVCIVDMPAAVGLRPEKSAAEGKVADNFFKISRLVHRTILLFSRPFET